MDSVESVSEPTRDQTSADVIQALRTITNDLAQQAGLAEMLTLIAEQTLACLGCDQVAVYLAEPGSQVLALCAVAGAEQLASTVYHLMPGQGTPGRATQTGRDQYVPDMLSEPFERPALRLPATRSELSVPIWNSHQPTGALTISAAAPQAFSPQVARHLALFAAQAAVAIRVADITLREGERALHSKLLTEISLSVSSTLELERVLQQAVTKVGGGLNADRCTLGHANLATGTLNTAIEYTNPLLSERRSLRNEHSILRHAPELLPLLQAGQVIIADEDNIHPAIQAIWPELAGRYGVRSLVWVPILRSGAAAQDFYSLRLMQVTHARRWSEAELELLRGIAAQLALALHNAQLYRAQLQTAAALQAKNDEMQSLVYSVSHDLQAPIVSLRGYADLLKARNSAQLDERGQGYVGRIVANSDYLTQLVNDLLELSRVGRVEERAEQVDVGPLVELVLNSLTSQAANARVQVVQPAEWPQVTYSLTRLRQVFSNLISNAFKFMGQQTQPRVELGWQLLEPEEGRGALIEFWVKDNGIGIPPAYHQRIFATFERLRQVEVEGTGIGLSIVKRIVESRGGTVRVDSTPGNGAAFYFTVPVGCEAGERCEAV